DPLAGLRANRGRYVAAALTIVRAWLASGETGKAPVGSFGQWCRLVRDPLIWLGEQDPLNSMAELRGKDPKRLRRLRLDAIWDVEFGKRGVELARVIKHALDRGNDGELLHRELNDALGEIATDEKGALSARKLRWWLEKNG